MERLAADDQLTVYYHHGFWQPMDTLRDKRYLEELWVGGTSALEDLVNGCRMRILITGNLGYVGAMLDSAFAQRHADS